MAEVVDVSDPEKRCRVRVNVYEIFDGVPVDDLPWANFNLSCGARPGEGAITPLKVGDKVWVQFVSGDTRRPIVTGAAQAAPGGIPNLPPEACQGGGQYAHKRTDKEPPVDAPPYYEDVVVCQNRALIQLCRAGNIRVTQMDSGSAIEITPAGHMILHCEGDMFVSVKGKTLETYDSEVKREYKADVTEEYAASLTQKIAGAWNLSANKGGSAKCDLAIDGNMSVSQSASVGGDVSAGGSVIDSGGNTNHHSH